jgi:lipopolysaccharide biosynthesis glycosyltransferase
LEFHVLYNGVPENLRRKVVDSLPAHSALIQWIKVDFGLFREFSTARYLSKATYTRLLIPKLFPDAISKVLYLDADLIVLDDLTPLWETDLDDAVVGAVLDRLDTQDGKNGVVGLPQVREYFNAGVLLINLHQWRKERISERALAYLSVNPRSPFADQDALNVACDGRWKKLHPRWNFIDFHQREQILDLPPERRPGIVHFATWKKPWNASVRSVHASFYETFRNRTKFSRTPGDKLWDVLKSSRARMKDAFYDRSFARR